MSLLLILTGFVLNNTSRGGACWKPVCSSWSWDYSLCLSDLSPWGLWIGLKASESVSSFSATVSAKWCNCRRNSWQYVLLFKASSQLADTECAFISGWFMSLGTQRWVALTRLRSCMRTAEGEGWKRGGGEVKLLLVIAEKMWKIVLLKMSFLSHMVFYVCM